MVSSTSRYVFTDEEVSQLANCTDQAELLHKFLRILNTKIIDPSAVYDAKETLGTSSDNGASILPKFFETQPNALHFEVAYALFKSTSSFSCLRLDANTTNSKQTTRRLAQGKRCRVRLKFGVRYRVYS